MYISRVQGAPCGEAKVQLYKGADGPEAKKFLNRRQMLLKFLSGKSTEKGSLSVTSCQTCLTSTFYCLLCAFNRDAHIACVWLGTKNRVAGIKVDLPLLISHFQSLILQNHGAVTAPAVKVNVPVTI